MRIRALTVLGIITAFFVTDIQGTTYEVGPSRDHATISDVPWESLSAGDSVRIHWRPEPYHEKWVICATGTEDSPITVSGIPGPAGAFPVIDGRDAVTRSELNYWTNHAGLSRLAVQTVPRT